MPEIGVLRWQHDLWYQTIVAHLEGHPDEVDLDYHPALNKPAMSRYAATAPQILRWFRKHNHHRLYANQVRPLNFLVSFQSRREPPEMEVGFRGRGRPRKQVEFHPIAPFDRDPAIAAANARDRDTGVAVSVDQLKTYAEALVGYHLSPESKFLNGEAFDSGWTERRHVIASGFNPIGKESNRWEEILLLGFPLI